MQPLLGVIHLADVRLDHPVLALSRDKQGTLNLAKLAAPPAPEPKTAAPKPSQRSPSRWPHRQQRLPKAAPFDFGLQHLALNDGAIHLQDQQTGANLGLSKLAVTLANISTVAHQPGRWVLRYKPASIRAAASAAAAPWFWPKASSTPTPASSNWPWRHFNPIWRRR